jgi:hypothetical protein
MMSAWRRFARRGAACLLLAGVLACIVCPSVAAYQKYGVRIGDRVVELKWKTFPIRYYVTDRGGPGVTADELQAAVGRAFATWAAAPNATLSTSFAGFTAAPPLNEDGQTTLGFLDRPDLDRVLGATDFLVDTVSGEIVEADIFFNSSFPWSVSSGGETGRFDLESIALHEIGHLLGLGHSALGETELVPGGRRVIAAESVMFPIAYSAGNISARNLRADDIAGISDVYPNSRFRDVTSSISGQVKKNGQGLFGAHMVAFEPRSGKLVGNFSLDDQGRFAMAGLDPGTYILRVEPLDDGDLDSFFDDPSQVDLDFGVTFLKQIVVAPAGGGSEPVVVNVRSK